MRKKLICLVLTLAFCLPSSLQAATIILVSDNKNSGNTDPVTGGPRDQRWIDLLEANGYIVDLSFANTEGRTLDNAKIAALNAADLIIVSRNTITDQYDEGDEPTQWNSITTPLIQQSAPFVLSDGDGWRWFDTLNSSTGQPDLEVVDTDHDLFSDLTLGANKQVAIIENQRSYIGNTTDAGNGMVLGKRADNGGCWIVEWKTGVEFYDGSGQFAGGPRIYFPIGRSGDSRDGEYNLTAEGEKVFLNAVRYMVGGAKTVRPNAHSPVPADGTIDVPRDVVLNWTPGKFANTHDVYLGTIFTDVNDAGRSNPSDVLVSQGQITATYDPGSLDFGRTYYWRIDEVNAPPDFTIFKGNVWSFTIEPYAYPVENITATASSANKAIEGPENTINGSGLDDDDLHSLESADMWLSSMTGAQPTWIQYEFDRIYKLHQMWVWNHNTLFESMLGFGLKDVTIEYSTNGADWTALGGVPEFAQAPGADGYAHNTTVDFDGTTAKYVRLTVNSNWGGFSQYGLSEVRFLYIPVWATEPSPDSGATDVGVDAILNWKTGREAAKHDVYISTDEQAVIDGNVPVDTVTESSYAPSLDLAGTYYWRIDEINDAEIPTTWQGDIWNLSTQEYLVVDDFESYNDIPAGQEGSNLVYGTWADGFENPVNGSTIGYNVPFQPTIETSIVYDGEQSVPLFYDNTVATYSEVTASVADLGVGRDWTKHGIKGLTLRFFGDPNNVLQQMYVKINGSRVTYDGSAEDTRLTEWQMWYIDLASIGVSLSNVTELAIGFERIGAVGGQGMVLLDGIRLYSYDRQLITPVDPGAVGLQAHYEFEGNTNDSSGNARHGSAIGNPAYVAGSWARP